MRRLFFIAAFVGLAAGIAYPQTPNAAGNAENGKRLFTKETCYFCHGTVGQGGRDGARIAQTALNVQGFIRYVRRPAGAMPAFTDKLLSDQELTDIYAYLKTLPAAKAPKDIPLLDQIRDK
jgi:ubiquinol-cytochrome c reductase cytochrome c subunit